MKKLTREDIRYINNYSGYGKKPVDKNFYIGLEIECVIPLPEEIVRYEILKSGLSKYVTVSDDGSIDAFGKNENSFELKVLVKDTLLTRVVNRLFVLLNQMRANVNESCGLHVHLDMRHKSIKTTYENLMKNKEKLYAQVSEERHNNEYCKPNSHINYETELVNNPYGNRKAFNTAAYKKHKTLEVRLHEGTMNPKKVIQWVKELKKHVA